MRKFFVIFGVVVIGFALCGLFLHESLNFATELPKSEYDLQRKSSLDVKVLSPSANSQREPAIHDDRVVWSEFIGGYWQIVLYNLSMETRVQLTDNALDHVYPSINDEAVIWWEGVAGEADRMGGWNYMTAQRIDLPANQVIRPKLGTNGITWVEGGGQKSIKFFAFSDNQAEIVSNGIVANWPSSAGSIIVWSDSRQGDMNIYGYDLSAKREFPISSAIGEQEHPDISGSIVVWQDNRQTGSLTNFDIYGYNLASASEFVVSARGGNEVYPKVSDDYVVWTDYVGSNVDIYAYDLSAAKLITVAADNHANGQPAIYESAIVWSQADSNDRHALSQIVFGQLPDTP